MNVTEPRPGARRAPGWVASVRIAGVDQPRVDHPDLAPNASLVDRIDLTPTVARFVVRPDSEIGPFEAGQYFALGLMIGGRVVLRPYSTASPRGSDRDLEFLVRLVHQGTFTPRLWALQPGTRLRIGRAKGIFRLRPGDPRTHLFVATGTGLAPFVSMLETLIADDVATSLVADPMSPRAVVIHGVSFVAELAYRDRLERLAKVQPRVCYVPVVSRPADPSNVDWPGPVGRLDARLDELCLAHRLDPVNTVAYLCGNPEMIARTEQILAARGFALDAIVSERYWPASRGPAPA